MKKRKIIFMVGILFVSAAMNANAQNADLMGLLAPMFTPGIGAFSAFMSSQAAATIENAVHFANTAMQALNTANNTYNQFQNMVRAEERALKNLTSVGNIKSYDDFMAWTNRQLDLERAAVESYNRTKVSVGNTTAGLLDITNLLENWDTYRVSESERARIYQKLGLSPANYAYVSTWKAMELDMLDESIGMVDTYKEKRKKDAALRAEMAENYKNAGDDGLTENSLAKDNNALQIQSIEVQEDIRDELADMNKRQAIESMKKRQIPEKARVSDTFSMGLGKSPVDVSSPIEFDD
jgi:hypothetical protein